MQEKIYVNGTLIWYYYICKREVWLMGHNIVPDQENENIELGRFIHENTYKRNKKEIAFGSVKFDILEEKDGQLIIGEIKKSSKYKKSATMQLAYYLMELEKANINAIGEIRYPKEKKKELLELTPKLKKELFDVSEEIRKIIESKYPPKVQKCPYCKSCGYQQFCWA